MPESFRLLLQALSNFRKVPQACFQQDWLRRRRWRRSTAGDRVQQCQALRAGDHGRVIRDLQQLCVGLVKLQLSLLGFMLAISLPLRLGERRTTAATLTPSKAFRPRATSSRSSFTFASSKLKRFSSSAQRAFHPWVSASHRATMFRDWACCFDSRSCSYDRVRCRAARSSRLFKLDWV